MFPASPDILIVGAGPCGALMASRLTAQGFSVLVLEAGPRFEAARDLANTEANAGKIMWTEPRNFVGKGSCRMGHDARTSVVNDFGQSHDVRNLFVADTSVFVTGSGLNPTLTAMALASRSVEFISDAARKGNL